MACTIHGNGIGFIPGAVFVWLVRKVDSVGDWSRSPRQFATYCCTCKIPGNVKPDDPDSPEGAGHWNASRQHRLIPRVPTGGKGLDKGGGMFRDRAFPCPAEFFEKDSELH